MPGLAGIIGKLNANVVVSPDQENTDRDTRRAIIDFSNKIRFILGKPQIKSYKSQDLRGTLKSIGMTNRDRSLFLLQLRNYLAEWKKNEKQKSASKSNGYIEITVNQLKKLKNDLIGLVIAERDKNGAKLYVE